MKLRGRKTKKCPRCGNECLISQAKCDDCGLLFARLDEATNKAGKVRLARHQKEQVIYVKKCPQDVKKWKLILMTIFLGLFGGHYFYVGRWKIGLGWLCYFFAVLFMGVIFNSYFLTVWSGQFFSIFGPITGVYTIIWLNDIRRVCFNSFKIPVSILSDEENEEYIKQKQEEKALKQEIKQLAKNKKLEDKRSETEPNTTETKEVKSMEIEKSEETEVVKEEAQEVKK